MTLILPFFIQQTSLSHIYTCPHPSSPSNEWPNPGLWENRSNQAETPSPHHPICLQVYPRTLHSQSNFSILNTGSVPFLVLRALLLQLFLQFYNINFSSSSDSFFFLKHTNKIKYLLSWAGWGVGRPPPNISWLSSKYFHVYHYSDPFYRLLLMRSGTSLIAKSNNLLWLTEVTCSGYSLLYTLWDPSPLLVP